MSAPGPTALLPGREALARPLRIGGVVLPNRIVMSPMTRGYCPDGVPQAASATYYRRRVEGGCGTIVTEGIGVDHPSSLGDAGLGEDELPVLHGPEALAGWQRVVAAVHEAGGLIMPQLWHQGVMRLPGTGPVPEAPTIGPSGVWGPRGHTSVEDSKVPADPVLGPPMTDSQIQDVIDAFIRDAVAARALGFDAIALHGAHGYLLDNFLWAGTNLRTDRWGGDPQRRAEFVVQIVRGIRRALGPDLPIFFRFSQWRLQDYRSRIAATPDELEALLGPIADAGVDVFDASTRYFDTPAFEGSPLGLAGWAKRLTGRLTMTVGGIGLSKSAPDARGSSAATAADNLDLLMARFERGEFDLIAVGRALIGDPDWPRKALSGAPARAFHPDQLETLD